MVRFLLLKCDCKHLKKINIDISPVRSYTFIVPVYGVSNSLWRYIMILQLQQKFFTIGGDKFAITDESGKAVFQASEKFFKLRANAHLYDLTGKELCYLEAKFSFLGHFDFLTNEMDRLPLGSMHGTFFPVPFLKKWRLEHMGKKFIVMCGPINCKVYPADENWKYDKKTLAGHIHKKLFKIRDTYKLDFDEKVLPPEIAALVTLWIDMINHNDEH